MWFRSLFAVCSLLAIVAASLVVILRPSSVEQEPHLALDLDQQLLVALARIAAKEHIIEDLAQGRTTLLKAAVLFRALDNITPKRPKNPHALYRAGSVEECLCRYVIFWAQIYLVDADPCLAESVASRLESDLELLLRQGPLQLPDPSSFAEEFERVMRPFGIGGEEDERR